MTPIFMPTTLLDTTGYSCHLGVLGICSQVVRPPGGRCPPLASLPDAERPRSALPCSMSDTEIRALTPETFDDFVALVERNGGMFAGCWCTKFHPACAE